VIVPGRLMDFYDRDGLFDLAVKNVVEFVNKELV
jgi:hypothetical protein